MKLFLKILFWIYFTIASAAFIVVIIYLVNHYKPFLKETKYESQLVIFDKYYLYYTKPDSTFLSLFNTNSNVAVDYFNKSESYFKDVKYKSKAVEISNADLTRLDSLSRKWPKKFQEITKNNLLGIYILDSAGFNGLTQIIHPTHNRFIIYLNSKLFKLLPNDWITPTSILCLKDEFKDRVQCKLFIEEQNIPIRTVEHVLLHEYAHIFSFLAHEAPLPDGRFSEKMGYYPLIESYYNEGHISYESRYSQLNAFEILSKKGLNNSEKLDLDQFTKLNKDLINTPFPTPYSTSNEYELVAELYTFYIHQNYLNQRYSMILGNNDTIYFAQRIDTAYIRKSLEGTVKEKNK